VLFFQSCKKVPSSANGTVVIGIAADIESLDPLNSLSITEGSITELLYLSLFQQKWNEAESKLETEPMLAQSWQWNNDSTSLIINLRKDVYWSDGIRFTSDDVIYSFDIYSDPRIETRLFGTFNFFYLEKDNSVDIGRSFTKLDSFKLQMNFVPGSGPDLYKIDLSIIPRHIYEKSNRQNYISSSASIKPVTNGLYRFVKWDKDQAIILKADKKSFLYNPNSVKEIVFKVVPDYNSRLTQLKKGEIDMMEDIRPEDIKSLRKEVNLNIVQLKGREYEYAGWNNIDPEIYNKKKLLIPHKLFGSASVRKALTLAINRKEILEQYLYNYGELAKGAVSPIFKNAVDTSFNVLPYNPEEASDILKQEGWTDKDNDGILEKGNTKFRFTLYIPGGNPRRSFVAVMIKNNLKAVGIDVEISTLEMGTFIDEMFAKKMDAWVVSWFVPVPVELKTYWYSDLNETPMNAISYRNKNVDVILDSLDKKMPEVKQNLLYKSFQKIINDDQPVTFLYWIDNITAYNKRIKKMNISPLGFVHRCWEWRTGNDYE
jgi:peptide/nickel transport system substrate-binding protein